MTWAAFFPHVTRSNISLYGCHPKGFLKGWLPSLGFNLGVCVRVRVHICTSMHTCLSRWDNASSSSQFSDQLSLPSALSCGGRWVLICSETYGICTSVHLVTSCVHLPKWKIVKPASGFSQSLGSGISLLGTHRASENWEFMTLCPVPLLS